jgi:hypothetical protein
VVEALHHLSERPYPVFKTLVLISGIFLIGCGVDTATNRATDRVAEAVLFCGKGVCSSQAIDSASNVGDLSQEQPDMSEAADMAESDDAECVCDQPAHGLGTGHCHDGVVHPAQGHGNGHCKYDC